MSPSSILSSVVFPLPLAPTRPTRTPGEASGSSSGTACVRRAISRCLGLDQALGLSIGRREVDLRGRRAGALRMRPRVHRSAGRRRRFARVTCRCGLSVRAAAIPLRAAPSSPATPAAWLALRETPPAVPETRCSCRSPETCLADRRGLISTICVATFSRKYRSCVTTRQAFDRSDRCLEPQDAFEVQMIGGLIEKQHVGRGYQCRRDGQALLPSSRKGRGRRCGISKPARPEHHLDANALFVFLERQLRQRPLGERTRPCRPARTRSPAVRRRVWSAFAPLERRHPAIRFRPGSRAAWFCRCHWARSARCGRLQPDSTKDPQTGLARQTIGERPSSLTEQPSKPHRRKSPALRDRSSERTRCTSRDRSAGLCRCLRPRQVRERGSLGRAGTCGHATRISWCLQSL